MSRELHLVIIGFNRPESLARLCTSLRDASYPAATAAMSISFALDHAANAGANK